MAGFTEVQSETLAETERTFAPKHSGYALTQALREYVIGPGGVPAGCYDRWLADLAACAEEGSYCYSVTTFVCLARR